MMLVTLILVMSWGARGQDVIIQRHFKGDIYTSGKQDTLHGENKNNTNSDRRMICWFLGTLNLCIGSQFEPF